MGTMFGNDSYNFISGPNGGTSVFGNQTASFGSDGQSAFHAGNSTFLGQGGMITRAGNMYFCNGKTYALAGGMLTGNGRTWANVNSDWQARNAIMSDN